MPSSPTRTRPTPRLRRAPSSPAVLPESTNTAPHRVASNFAALSLAEIACRGVAMVVTFTLAARLGKEGYGKVEFAFNVVFWLVLLVRDGLDTASAFAVHSHLLGHDLADVPPRRAAVRRGCGRLVGRAAESLAAIHDHRRQLG